MVSEVVEWFGSPVVARRIAVGRRVDMMIVM
jgi:hypothetical protein